MLSLVFCGGASSNGWAIFSEHAQMKNFVIVDAGGTSKLELPVGKQWATDVYQMSGRCFVFQGLIGLWGFGEKATLLLMNSQRVPHLALIQNEIGSIKVEVKPISLVQCPESSSVPTFSDDPETRLKQIQKLREELDAKIKELRNKKYN